MPESNHTPAPIGADAWPTDIRSLLPLAARLLEQYAGFMESDRRPMTADEARGLAAALASAAQPAAHQRALENVALLADILNRRPAMNAGLTETYAHWTAEVYDLMGAMAAEPANDAAAPKAAPAAQGDALPGWLPITPELLTAIEAGERGDHFWLAAPGASEAFRGVYEWRQGRSPHGFKTGFAERWAAAELTHVMPYSSPALPEAARAAKEGAPPCPGGA